MKDPIKIVYLIDMLDGFHGGTENQLLKLFNGLNKEKFTLHLICLSNSKWFKQNSRYFNTETTGININKFRELSTYVNLLRLVKLLNNYNPDILHTFFPTSNIIGVLAARVAGIKNTISSRRDYGEWMNKKYLLATKVANKFVKKIIVNSNKVKELTILKESAQDEKVEVLYNGIDLSKFREMNRDNGVKDKLNIPFNNKVVGIIANL